MKREEMLMILVVAVVAGIFSMVFSQILFGGQKKELQAEVVNPISAEFKKPDPNVFNDQAINPTQLIQIGDNSNKNPF